MFITSKSLIADKYKWGSLNLSSASTSCNDSLIEQQFSSIKGVNQRGRYTWLVSLIFPILNLPLMPNRKALRTLSEWWGYHKIIFTHEITTFGVDLLCLFESEGFIIPRYKSNTPTSHQRHYSTVGLVAWRGSWRRFARRLCRRWWRLIRVALIRCLAVARKDARLAVVLD